MLSPEIRSRVNWSAARYYFKAVACFLLVAIVFTQLLRFELYVWLHLSNNFIGPLIWAMVFLCMAPEFQSLFFAASKNETQSIYEFESSEPKHLGQMIKALCKKRKLRMPKVWIEEQEHFLNFQPGAAHDSLFYSNVIFLSRFVVATLPPPLLQALLAHELRHIDTSINMWERAIRILGRVGESMLIAFGINITMLALLSGQIGVFLIQLPLWYGALLLFAVFHRYLDGVCARAVEHHADILAAADTENHHALAFLLRSLDHFGMFRERIIEMNVEMQERFEQKIDAIFNREDPKAEEEDSTDVHQQQSPTKDRLAVRLWNAFGLLLRCIRGLVSFAFNLPGLLFAMMMFGIFLSWRRFPSHPSTDKRVAVLEDLYGPTDPFEPPELPNFDDFGPDFDPNMGPSDGAIIIVVN